MDKIEPQTIALSLRERLREPNIKKREAFALLAEAADALDSANTVIEQTIAANFAAANPTDAANAMFELLSCYAPEAARLTGRQQILDDLAAGGSYVLVGAR